VAGRETTPACAAGAEKSREREAALGCQKRLPPRVPHNGPPDGVNPILLLLQQPAKRQRAEEEEGQAINSSAEAATAVCPALLQHAACLYQIIPRRALLCAAAAGANPHVGHSGTMRSCCCYPAVVAVRSTASPAVACRRMCKASTRSLFPLPQPCWGSPAFQKKPLPAIKL
jgi:hypothetical protein